ncbi:MAG: hypothetical protein GF411_14825 [Candidatus Lokiarchaeota archaeon]|nr:hypothetical protein [Candidatus Lokiarchaeota archaeon]
MVDILNPSLDPSKLSVEEKIELVRQSDGLLVDILPEGLKVGGDLWLNECSSLISLPEGLKIKGNLDLRGCSSLISLPEGLEVGGSLYLDECSSLISLPEGLKIRGDLYLNGCSSLPYETEKDIRESVKIGGRIIW